MRGEKGARGSKIEIAARTIMGVGGEGNRRWSGGCKSYLLNAIDGYCVVTVDSSADEDSVDSDDGLSG